MKYRECTCELCTRTRMRSRSRKLAAKPWPAGAPNPVILSPEALELYKRVLGLVPA